MHSMEYAANENRRIYTHKWFVSIAKIVPIKLWLNLHIAVRFSYVIWAIQCDRLTIAISDKIRQYLLLLVKRIELHIRVLFLRISQMGIRQFLDYSISFQGNRGIFWWTNWYKNSANFSEIGFEINACLWRLWICYK